MILDRFKEPSSWAGIAVAVVAFTVAAFVPLDAIPQTVLIVAGLVGVLFGVGLAEKVRAKF